MKVYRLIEIIDGFTYRRNAYSTYKLASEEKRRLERLEDTLISQSMDCATCVYGGGNKPACFSFEPKDDGCECCCPDYKGSIFKIEDEEIIDE